jgi:prefoldin subunit 5
MDDLNKRNTESVKLSLQKAMDMAHDQQVQIDNLQSTIGTLNNKVDEMQRTISMLRAMAMGSGPTSR